MAIESEVLANCSEEIDASIEEEIRRKGFAVAVSISDCLRRGRRLMPGGSDGQ